MSYNAIEDKLSILREIQDKYPLSHVGGSIGLMLYGIDLKRDLSASDMDITCPFLIDVGTIDRSQDSSMASDFDETFDVQSKETVLSNGIIVDKDGLLVSTDDIDPRVKYGSMNWNELQELQRKVGKIAPLEIAAPLKDFDTSGMEVNDFKLSKIEVPDPVVLHPVMFKGVKHYLIVTCWGLEATDELVVNQRNN